MRCALVLMLGLALVGCGVEMVATTAIQSELQAEQLKAMRGQIQGAAATTGKINLERAISAYQAEKGYYPPSLDALAPNYLPAIPTKPDGSPYGYDPSTGRILDGPAAPAGGPTPQDYQTMQQIREAINRYGMTVGYYPPNLDALAPTYLSAPPRTSSGEEFNYNNQNGYVGHPRQAMSAPAPARPNVPSGGVGAGPMGEVMTGIGMQQQLNSMSQSGANAAGSYSRRAVQNANTGYNDRQNQVMDDLGL